MDSQHFGVKKMDKQTASRIAKKYIRFVKNMNPDVTDAYIFGSCAKGTIREDSDIDLAIIFRNLSDSFDMQATLMKLRQQFDTRIEPHPFRESDFNISNPLVNEILKTGIKII
jgi:predicted nucleotidyltransferase